MNVEQNVYVAHLNTVRKSWVNKLPEHLKEIFKAMPQSERFEHYKRIDEAVIAGHRENTSKAREAGNKVNEAESKKLLDVASETVVQSLVNGTFA